MKAVCWANTIANPCGVWAAINTAQGTPVTSSKQGDGPGQHVKFCSTT